MVSKDPQDAFSPEFDGWLNAVLHARLEPLLSARTPEFSRPGRKGNLTTIVKVAVATAAATLALGAGAAFASGETATLSPHGLAVGIGATLAHRGHPAAADARGVVSADATTKRDAHGDAVSSAAHSCPNSPGDAHGDCVTASAHKRP